MNVERYRTADDDLLTKLVSLSHRFT